MAQHLTNQRFWELDALRGFAVITMILFHLIFDLRLFAGIDLLSGEAWFWIPRLIGGSFIFLAGIALTLSKQKPLKRGLQIFSWGLLITATTYLFFPEGTIWFGILHFIGLGIIVVQPFLKEDTLFWAGLTIVTGVWLENLVFNHPWLLWLGFRTQNFYSFDYYPLLPWIGVMLLGMWFSKKFYSKRKRVSMNAPILNELQWLGRHSLLVYLMHQPVLIALIHIIM